MPKKKHSTTQKIFFGLGKAIGWAVVTLTKAVYYTIKGITVGIISLTKKTSKTVKQSREKHQLKAAQPKGNAVYSPLKDIKTKSGSFEDFQRKLNNDSLIVAIAGKRGSGKSGLGFRLLENIHAETSRPCFALGVKQSVIPSWIQSINDLEQASNKGVVLVDEGAISFSSRSSMSKKNKELASILAIARHKDLTLIFITQNTGMIDKNVLNLCDTIVLKEGSLLQEKMERSVMKDMYRTANEELKSIQDRKSHCYVFDSDFEGLIQASLPSFWSSKVSKNQA